jgi:Response regulator receiver domain
MRALIFELRPEALREEGLPAAIRKHAQAVAARADLVIDVETPEDWPPCLSTWRSSCIGRPRKLTNVVKHADASRAQIRLLGAAAILAEDHATRGRTAGRQLNDAQHTRRPHHHPGAGAAGRCRAAGLAPVQGPPMSRSDGDGPGQRPVRVFIVDDHAVVRRGLRSVLELMDDMEVVGEAADGQGTLEQIAALVAASRPPDVALRDLLIPGTDGVTATAAITDRHPELGWWR